jgi:hypothetical protein
MKTVTLTNPAQELRQLLDEANTEDILVRLSDGRAFLLAAVEEDFDEEIVRTRQNAALMSLLEERAKEAAALSLDQVRAELGLKD